MKHITFTTFFISFLLFFSADGFSQGKFYTDGYIVTIEKDTIKGYIKNMNKVRSGRVVKFMPHSGEKQLFYPREILSYSRNRKEYRSFFLPLDLIGRFGFFKLIRQGEVNLYVHYTQTQNNQGQSSKTKRYYLQTADNDYVTLVRFLGFRNQMTEYFAREKELVTLLQKREYRYFDIEEIVEFYNELQTL